MEVRTITNRQPIQRYIAQGRLRWFGHLLRSPLNHPASAIYTFNPRAAGWSRPRGAPRTRWSDVLSKDLKQLGTTLTEASNIALDRTRWRSTIVARVVYTPSWQEPYTYSTYALHSAGLDTISAAQMVFDRPQWKAFVCGLPTLEPEQGYFAK